MVYKRRYHDFFSCPILRLMTSMKPILNALKYRILRRMMPPMALSLILDLLVKRCKESPSRGFFQVSCIA
jgi:hypothetical protein